MATEILGVSLEDHYTVDGVRERRWQRFMYRVIDTDTSPEERNEINKSLHKEVDQLVQKDIIADLKRMVRNKVIGQEQGTKILSELGFNNKETT